MNTTRIIKRNKLRKQLNLYKYIVKEIDKIDTELTQLDRSCLHENRAYVGSDSDPYEGRSYNDYICLECGEKHTYRSGMGPENTVTVEEYEQRVAEILKTNDITYEQTPTYDLGEPPKYASDTIYITYSGRIFVCMAGAWVWIMRYPGFENNLPQNLQDEWSTIMRLHDGIIVL